MNVTKSRLNVRFLTKPIHVITIWLAIVIVWPWNIAFSVIESSQNVVPTGSSSFLIARSQRGQQINRFGKGSQSTCPAIAEDYEESEDEGDDIEPWQAASDIFLSPPTPDALGFALGSVPQAVSLPLPPIVLLCRLQC
jgi:hypothetical protein